jgi:hypothetical protein
MSNRLTFEFAVKVRKSTIRELQASRRELLVQLAHKTYEPAREKAEERGETMIHSAEKRAIRRSGRTWRFDLWRANREKAIQTGFWEMMTKVPDRLSATPK